MKKTMILLGLVLTAATVNSTTMVNSPARVRTLTFGDGDPYPVCAPGVTCPKPPSVSAAPSDHHFKR